MRFKPRILEAGPSCIGQHTTRHKRGRYRGRRRAGTRPAGPDIFGMTSALSARVTTGSTQGAIFVPDCAHERRLRCPREAAWRPILPASSRRSVRTTPVRQQSLAAPDQSFGAPPFRSLAGDSGTALLPRRERRSCRALTAADNRGARGAKPSTPSGVPGSGHFVASGGPSSRALTSRWVLLGARRGSTRGVGCR